MIGLFDSGDGGLTILSALEKRLPGERFVYLGDHENVPYGERSPAEVVELTRAGVKWLFGLGCGLVILACNTATVVACRSLQTDWLPASPWTHRNVLGVVAPTVETATGSSWQDTAPPGPRQPVGNSIAVFGTRRTTESNVYAEEIVKRSPNARVIQQACPGLVDAIETGRPSNEVDSIVSGHVAALVDRCATPDTAILGCTHFALVESAFRRFLPPSTTVLSQPDCVAESLERYLQRHSQYSEGPPTDRESVGQTMHFTTRQTRAEQTTRVPFQYQNIRLKGGESGGP